METTTEIDPSLIFWMGAVYVTIVGALIGSFLNVVIYRVPAGLSVVRPRSRCPVCHTPIRWYDNVPMMSWLLLRGKCRDCGTPISPRYALVELLTAALALATWHHVAGFALEMPQFLALVGWWPLVGVFVLKFTFVATLVAITFIDFDHFIIPHSLSFPLLWLGLAAPWIIELLVTGPTAPVLYAGLLATALVYAGAAVFAIKSKVDTDRGLLMLAALVAVGLMMNGFVAYLHSYAINPRYLQLFWPPVTPGMAVGGAVAGVVSLGGLLLAWFGIRNKEGLGMGDVYLAGVLGAWLGWPALTFIMFAAAMQGLAAYGITRLLGIEFAQDADELFAEDEGGAPSAPATAAPDPPGEAGAPETAPDQQSGDPDFSKAAVPFGPFLALGALEYLLLGPYLPMELSLMNLYL